jgi:hypothetical protein
MRVPTRRTLSFLVAVLVAAVALSAGSAQAHCDALDGPVVKAAKKALETGSAEAVLIWVQARHEPEVAAALRHAREVRALGSEARELADRFFLETVVRLHREGESAPYTGLKPAGLDLGPAIPAADAAVEKGSAADLLKLLSGALHAGLHQRFEKVMKTRDFQPADVAAGRDFVAAYVDFLHYVEDLHRAAASDGAHHQGAQAGAAHHH